MQPGIVVEGHLHFGGTQAHHDGRIQHQLFHHLGMTGHEAAAGDGAPAPAQHIQLLLAGDLEDLGRGGRGILGGIVGIGHEAVFHFLGFTITGHIEGPDSEAARGKVAGQAVVGIVHVELMRGIGQAVHQQDLALGLRPGHGQTLQMQGDAVALQREGLDLIFRGGISTGLDRGDLKGKKQHLQHQQAGQK